MPASPENRNQAPRAKKSLGQHFLRREEICDRIAALLLPQAEDRVLEIGPGPGALTRAPGRWKPRRTPACCCWKRTATGRPNGSARPLRAPRPC